MNLCTHWSECMYDIDTLWMSNEAQGKVVRALRGSMGVNCEVGP